MPLSTDVLETRRALPTPRFHRPPNAHAPSSLESPRARAPCPRRPEGRRFPVARTSRDGTVPVPPASSTSKPCSPCESVPTTAGISPRSQAVTLLAFSPSRALPLAPRVLLPARALRPERPTLPPAVGHATRLRGPRSPQSQVKPHHAPKRATRLTRQSPVPFETGPHRLSAAPRLPRRQAPGREPSSPVLGASKYVSSDESREIRPLS